MRSANSRVGAVLQAVEKFEGANFAAVNNSVIRKALEALDQSIQGDHVKEVSFKAALERLRSIKQPAKAEKDPLTEAVLGSLSKSRDEFAKMDKGQQDQLVMLSDAQREQVKALDKNLREA